MSNKVQYVRLSLAMIVYGTIGIFVKYCGFPTGIICFVRGFIGAFTLVVYCLLRKKRINVTKVGKSLWILLLSGTLIGFNWVMLFEAYNYTTVAVATLCYYFDPIFIIIFSPLVLKEKFSVKKLVCVMIALLGMAFISGVFDAEPAGENEYIGIILGVTAALTYAIIVFLNKLLPDTVNSYERSVVQLVTAGVIMLIYSLLQYDFAAIEFDLTSIILLMVIGIVHTGVAYSLYFGAVMRLPAQSSAMFSYIDPVVAVLVSAVVLGEKITLGCIIGSVLILGSTFVSEISIKIRKKADNRQNLIK